MTANILQSELTTLLQDAKRKHPDVRVAAERSLSDLKSLSITSEAQLSGDLVRKPAFIEPFILASKTQNGKLASPSVVCLQRLVAGGAIPRERLRDVLEAFREFSATGLDSQLKVLQSLPAILQTYKSDIQEELLFLVLEICGILASNKSPVIANTATATFQQLVSTVFEKVSNEDDDATTTATVELQLGSNSIRVGPSASDAFHVLNDLCVMLEGERSEHIGPKILPPSFILEVVESVVANSSKVFRRHKELIFILRKRAVSAILRLLSERQTFDTGVRAMRLLALLIRNHLDALHEDGEMILSFLIYLLDPESGVSWKRILSMEAWRTIYSDIRLMRLIFTKFDMVEGRKNVLQDQMGAMVRIAAEKPALIGLGHQSTVPQRRGIEPDANDEQASIEALGVAGIVGSAVSAEATVTGISVEWSVPRQSFIDQLDKSTPPPIPDTYIYSLILGMLVNFSENLTRFIMPLSVPKDLRSRRTQSMTPEESAGLEETRPEPVSRMDTDSSSKRRQVVLLNPLAQEGHPQLENIKATASMIEACWPAFLASCSTFFYAALDAEHYHGLVRAFQKLTQVSGVLRLKTPRDALLTTLGKAAVPVDAFDLVPPTPRGENGTNGNHSGVSNPGLLSPTTERPRPSFEISQTALTTRNLLCLRALLNLGIALGPTFDVTAWSIILSTLQQSELVIKLSIESKRRRASGSHGNLEDEDALQSNLGAEITAVQTAAKRMFSATFDYPSEPFQRLLEALCNMTGKGYFLQSSGSSMRQVQHVSETPTRPPRRHQPTKSVSTTMSGIEDSDEELEFVLGKLPIILDTNKERLAKETPEESGWSMIIRLLLFVVHDSNVGPEQRLVGSEVLGKMSLSALRLSNTGEPRSQAEIQKRALSLMQLQLQSESGPAGVQGGKHSIERVLHEHLLRSLETILGSSGEQIVAGWNLVFDVINSVFSYNAEEDRSQKESLFRSHPPIVSVDLLRASFQSIQLLGSDFLDRLPPTCILAYIGALHDFGAQVDDLNIALTSTTSFLSVIDFLREHMEGPPQVVTSNNLLKDTSSKEINIAANALWIVATRYLAELALDERDDIRNAATKLLLRTFENEASSISPEMWQNCSETIFFRLLKEPYQDQKDAIERVPWVQSSISLLEGYMRLLIDNISTLVDSSNFDPIFSGFFACFTSLADLTNLEMDECVYEAASSLLKAMSEKRLVTEARIRIAWTAWSSKSQRVQVETSDTTMQPSQAALAAYTDFLLQICQLSDTYPSVVDPELILRTCEAMIFRARHQPYTSDIARITPEQDRLLRALKFTYSKMENSAGDYFRTLIKFVNGPHPTTWREASDQQHRALSKRPTLIAFSAAVLENISDIYATSKLDPCALDDWAVLEMLECIRNVIACKDGREVNGAPPLWQVATNTAVTITMYLAPVVLNHQQSYDVTVLNEFVGHLTDTIGTVLGQSPEETSVNNAQPQGPSNALADAEAFDIPAFRKLHEAVTPLLSSGKINESIRLSYALTLFHPSLLFLPFCGDFPEKLDNNPLSNLYHIRNGCVDTPIPVNRPKIAYVALEAMFNLAAGRDLHVLDESSQTAKPTPDDTTSKSHQDRSFDRTPLSRAVAPYLILRCALPLKSFIADQPLRGLMPIPHTLALELQYIINNFIDLRTIDEAIPPITTTTTTKLLLQDTNHFHHQPTNRHPSKSHFPHLHPLMLQFWSIFKRTAASTSTNLSTSSSALATTKSQPVVVVALEDAIERWMTEAALFCGEAEHVKVRRNEWWK